MTSSVVQKPALNYNVDEIRRDFPIYDTEIYGKKPVFLDTGASAQKPRSVIERLDKYYSSEYANIHRGVYYLSQLGTQLYEDVREQVRDFINAKSEKEVIFVRGATEGINLVAQSWGRTFLKEGDEIILSRLEHHSNIVPWQLVAQATGAVIKVAPIDDRGNFLFDEFEKLVTERTKLVSVAHISNSLGTILPVDDIIRVARNVGAKVLLDGCQAIPHQKIDVQALDVDFYVFSAHKLYGPTGVGILYGKEDLLNAMPPYQGGGDMIRSVTFEETTYNDLPHKFEAGTPHIAGGIGLGPAIDYVENLGFDNIMAHEQALLDYARERLPEVHGLNILSRADNMAGIISFTMDNAHPHDIGTILDQDAIAIRAGHHCAQPVMDFFDVSATARVSLGLYNNFDDIDQLVDGLHKVNRLFA